MGARGEGTADVDRSRWPSLADEMLRKAAFDGTATAFFVVDENRRCVYVNEAAEALTGFTLEDLNKISLHEAFHHSRPDGSPYPKEECPLFHAFRDRTPANGEEYFVRRDGTFFPANYRLRPVEDDEGFLGMVMEVRDIALEKQTSEALQRSEERFRTLVTTHATLVWIAGPDGCVIQAPNWESFTGQSLEAALGWGWLECVHPHDRPYVEKTWKSELENRRSTTFEYRLRHHSGEYRYVSVALSPLLDGDGQLREWIGSVTDVTEQRKADEARARLAAIVESSDDAILSKDLDGVIRTWNRGAQRIFGYTADETVGQHITMLIPPDRHSEEGVILSKIRRGEKIEHYETVRCRKDGAFIDVSLTISPIVDSSGRVIGASKVCRDITDRKRSEEARAHLAAIVQSSDDAIVSKNLDGIIRSWNRGAERIFGYGAHEAVGRPITLIIPQERTKEETDILSKLRRGQRIEHFETVRRRKDGSYIDVSLTISPIIDADGRIVGASKVARDISERKRSESQLREHTQTLETFNRLAASLAAELDPKRLGQVVVDAGVELSGAEYGLFCYYPFDEVAGVGPILALAGRAKQLVAGDQVSELTAVLPERLPIDAGSHTELTLSREQLEQLLAGLSLRGLPIESTMGVAIPSRDGRARGCLLFSASTPDLFVERKRDAVISLARQAATALDNAILYEQSRRLNETLEEKVRNRTSELEHLNYELESFNYSVSHDLRAPLRGIAGFSQILLDDYGPELDETSRHYLERIQTGIQRMGRLIDDLLDLSRLTRARLQPKEVDITALARGVAEELSDRFPERSVDVAVQPNLRGYGDAALLRILLENLLGNAWKFTADRERASIEVGVEMQGGQCVYFVRDNGVGFSMRYADKLFVPFQRLHNRDEYEGSGIGLATVQRIVHRHRGTIWAESVPDRGATFYFTLRTAAGD